MIGENGVIENDIVVYDEINVNLVNFLVNLDGLGVFIVLGIIYVEDVLIFENFVVV